MVLVNFVLVLCVSSLKDLNVVVFALGRPVVDPHYV